MAKMFRERSREVCVAWIIFTVYHQILGKWLSCDVF